MANTDFLSLALTAADETGLTFKEWRQLINGTVESNMLKIDAGVEKLDAVTKGTSFTVEDGYLYVNIPDEEATT